jgi:hypothetical protein
MNLKVLLKVSNQGRTADEAIEYGKGEEAPGNNK